MFQDSSESFMTYYMIASLLLLMLVVAIVTYAFLHQKKVIQLRTRLHDEEIRAQQAIFYAIQEGEEKERKRLAEELHDGIGARLSGLKMNLEYLHNNVTDHRELVSKIFNGVAEALEEVREISHNLLPYSFNNKNLDELLTNYMEQLTSMNGCSYHLFMNAPVTGLNNTLKLHCFRIIAELLNNIHKHAKATEASVQINAEDNKLEILIEDDGIGFDKDLKTDGIGLTNIQNRIRFCKGSFKLESSGSGTLVVIEIPLNQTT